MKWIKINKKRFFFFFKKKKEKEKENLKNEKKELN
jgi:hypothetical protein